MKAEIQLKHLLEKALKAREIAYAPFSNFMVGAAILGSGGTVYSGCNVENSSYGLSICAERVALFKGVSEGEKTFKAIAIVADWEEPVLPCGACRQVLAEFNKDMIILAANMKGFQTIKRLSELLPDPFLIQQHGCD